MALCSHSIGRCTSLSTCRKLRGVGSFRNVCVGNQWASLEFAALWVFEAVAGRDGNIDAKEEAVLVRALHEAHASPNALVREAWRAVNDDYANTQERYHRDPRDLTQGLHDVEAALRDLVAKKKLSPEVALDFRRALLQLGVDVARASGGFLGLGFGDKMSGVERGALEKISVIFELPFDA